MRTVGILGGMGPEATVLLMQKVIAAVPATDDADHIPLIVDQNPQVPSRIAHLIEGTGADPAPVLVAMARRLEGAGAQALAMPCNTGHHYAEDIRAAVTIPFLDMVTASARLARERAGHGARVGLLASPAVARVGLFDRALAAEGVEVIHPEDGAALLAAIRSIKARGPDEGARATLRDASAQLLVQGANLQLIACTEFSLIAEAVAPGVRGIDTLDVLVAEIVGFARASA
jgi:aspartate racemase